MGTPHVQTKHEIQALLDGAGARPRKSLGQHFLIDGNLMRRLVACAELDPRDCVLEVGGGTGGLTDLLAPRVRKVICVEADREMCAILEDRFREAAGVTIVQGDVLLSKHRLMSEVAEAIDGYDGGETVSEPATATGRRATGGTVKLVANLPYRVATPVLMNLLLNHPSVRRLCYTVQAEVGERITARPNTKAYGPLSIVAQMLCSLKTITRIRPAAFWPKPAVDSVMIRMDVHEAAAIRGQGLRDFANLVRKTFDHRRKTIRSALGYVLSDSQRDAVCQHLDSKRRPESFDVDEWIEIYREVSGEGRVANSEC